MRLPGLFFIQFMLAGCGLPTSGDAIGSADNVMEDLVMDKPAAGADEAPPVTRPAHKYQFREGDLYGYVAAISEEERKVGRAAGDVLMYRYKGFWDGLDHLEQVDDYGRILSSHICSRPCVAIRSYAYGQASRIAFNPDSIIGAAFEDASRGYLADSRPPPPGTASEQPDSPGLATPSEAQETADPDLIQSETSAEPEPSDQQNDFSGI